MNWRVCVLLLQYRFKGEIEMAKNTTHKYWFWFSYCSEHFYFSVPMKDNDALILICRVGHAFNPITNGCLFSDFPARKAYDDIRKGIPVRSFDYALKLWKDVLPRYYTKVIDSILSGF